MYTYKYNKKRDNNSGSFIQPTLPFNFVMLVYKKEKNKINLSLLQILYYAYIFFLNGKFMGAPTFFFTQSAQLVDSLTIPIREMANLFEFLQKFA